jgi:glycosyltransferase involved in cell wall biosynthesis
VPGRDVPAVFLEHNVPQGAVNSMRHPLADREDLVIVHVTHFNDLFWDCGSTPTRVVEHGIPDPGHRYTGELPRIAAVINEARRRRRVTGTDLLERFSDLAPIDLYGIDAAALGGTESLVGEELFAQLCRRRLYLHPNRWTSLGLSLLEAMFLGMPVVAVATTEVVEAVPPGAGIISTRVETLRDAVRELLHDGDLARSLGEAGRRAALRRYGIERFLREWDEVFEDATSAVLVGYGRHQRETAVDNPGGTGHVAGAR